jgi:hypothetical protein
VEAKAFKTSTVIVTTRFLYEYILTRCPLAIVTDQGVRVINDTIKYLTKQFLLKHVSSTTYCLEGNGQVESINKVIGRLMNKLVNDKRIDWDEHLTMVLFSYRTTYKVAT